MAPKRQASKKVAAAKGKSSASEAKAGSSKATKVVGKKTKSKPISPELSSDSEEMEMHMPSDSEEMSSEDMPKRKKVYGIRIWWLRGVNF